MGLAGSAVGNPLADCSQCVAGFRFSRVAAGCTTSGEIEWAKQAVCHCASTRNCPGIETSDLGVSYGEYTAGLGNLVKDASYVCRTSVLFNDSNLTTAKGGSTILRKEFVPMILEDGTLGEHKKLIQTGRNGHCHVTSLAEMVGMPLTTA